MNRMMEFFSKQNLPIISAMKGWLERNSVNIIRSRARGGNQALLPSLGTDVTDPDLLDAIYHERRVELGMECHCFFDLVLTGRAATELVDWGYNASIHEVFPIPLVERTLSGGLITQNNGY